MNRTNFFKTFISILILVIIQNACTPAQKEETNNSSKDIRENVDNDELIKGEGFTLQSGTKYFNDKDLQYIQVVDTNTIRILSGVPSKLSPKVGNIILVGVSDASPDGFMGRVLSVSETSEYIMAKTEPAMLEDIFEELHLDTEVDVLHDVSNMVDEDGNYYACEQVEDNFWGNDDETKATISGEKAITQRINVSASGFNGSLVVQARLSVKIDLTKGKLQNYDIQLFKRSYITGSVSWEGEKERYILPQTTLRLPFSIPIGPIALRPAILSSIKLSSSGKIKLGGTISVELENVTTRFHNGEHTESYGDGTPVSLSADYLDCKGSVSVMPRVALQFGVWGQNLLAFGVDATPELSLALSGIMLMDDDELLKKELTTLLTLTPSFGVYMYSRLLSPKLGQLRARFSMPSKQWSIDILDYPKNGKVIRSTSSFSAQADFMGKTLMEVDETGFALFLKDSDKPEQVAPTKKQTATKADMQNANVSFPYADNPFNYTIRPYNKIGDKIYFGNVIREAVDMGLSVLWASMNIGSEKPSQIGTHYPWGRDFSSEGWDSSWRLPSRAELEELIDNCTWGNESVNGHNGFVASSKLNGNVLFFPRGGVDYGTEIGNKDFGEYWSSEQDEYAENNAYRLQISDDFIYCSSKYKENGRLMRPVIEYQMWSAD